MATSDRMRTTSSTTTRPTTLLQADIETFERLHISAELVEAAGIRRVTHAEAISELGIRYRSQHLEGVAFPYLDPVTGHIRSYRLRRDHPELEDGNPVGKYLCSPDRRCLYFPPGAGPLLDDAGTCVVTVESEKAALALMAVATTAGRKLLVLATGGCWGWRGTTGKTTDAAGARVDEKGPLSDFDRIAWGNRDAVILFDSNAATNPSVQAARRALASELGGRGARVRIADVPAEQGINGPDDYGSRHGGEALLALVDAAAPASGGTEPTERATKGESQSTVLVRLARETGAEFFHDDDQAYVQVPEGDHHETYRLRSKLGRTWLQRLFIDGTEKAPSSLAIADALNTLEASALRGPEHRVHVRIAAQNGAIYIDLGDPTWKVVAITEAGWNVLREPAVRFRRPRGLLALPEPRRGGNIGELRRFVNLDDAGYMLLVAWLLAALRGRGPYPVVVLNGEHGSAKSTLSRIIKALLDPNRADLRSEPREPRDLMIAADNNHVLAFDNLSRVTLSDEFCRLATGSGFSTRTLYENREEEIFDAVRPIVINGIAELATKPDLVSRAVFLNLLSIPDDKRRDESEFWADFENVRPEIIGALFDIVRIALRREAQVRLPKKPRMADFAVWIAAAEPACPWEVGAFMDRYAGNRQQAVESVLDGDPVAELVRSLASTGWRGTATELLAELNRITPEAVLRRKDWFTKPRQLRNELQRLAPALRAIGIDVVLGKRTADARLITIIKRDEQSGACSSPSSSASPAVGYQALSGDEGNDAGKAPSLRSSSHEDRLQGPDDAGDEHDVADPTFTTGDSDGLSDPFADR